MVLLQRCSMISERKNQYESALVGEQSHCCEERVGITTKVSPR